MYIFDKKRVQSGFLICVDSDGCVMDTMNIKHLRCFGPCLIEEWQLDPWQEEIIKLWNSVNLYSLSRGINRFLGLAEVLKEVNAKYRPIDGIEELCNWVADATELSNGAVIELIEKGVDGIFNKTLSWSQKVNKAIEALPADCKLPFVGSEAGLKAAHDSCEVAVVSSANEEALMEEWQGCGLMESVDYCLSQNDGSKVYCIGSMLEMGYRPQKVLMVGDAPGDRAAAEKNGVHYYPILVGKEHESWQRFLDEALPRFLQGGYDEEYQRKLNDEFVRNLSR